MVLRARIKPLTRPLFVSGFIVVSMRECGKREGEREYGSMGLVTGEREATIVPAYYVPHVPEHFPMYQYFSHSSPTPVPVLLKS